MALNVGATFAGYRIVRLLGSGGMGEVYLAEHPRLPRRDALKVLPAAVSADREFRERFHREADLAATLFHPHIVGVHDRGEFNGQLWISMDFVDGPDAGQLLRRRYPAGMPRDEAIAVLSAIAAALDHAHANGLLHRDVKPANILLTDESADRRRVMLADFGIARPLNDISPLTATNTALGTIDYAAPEQLLDLPLDGRADQYSLAATAFHLFTGSPPYRHSRPTVTISRHLSGTPPAIGTLRPDLADLDGPMMVALSKDPAHRYPSCRQFVEALTASPGGADPADLPAPTRRAPRAKPGHLRADVAGAPQPAPRRRPVPPRPAWPLVSFAALGLLAAVALFGDPWPGDRPRVPAASSDGATPPSGPHRTGAAGITTTETTTVSAPATTTTVTTTVAPRLTPTMTPVTPSTRPDRADDPGPAGVPAAAALPAPATTRAAGVTDSPDGRLVTSRGWDYCIRTHDWWSCLRAARDAAGAPFGATTPVTGDGVWAVPQRFRYGDYRAAVGPGGRCFWYGYDARGRIVDSGVFSSAGNATTATVTPTMTAFQTFGCTPWFRVAPLN